MHNLLFKVVYSSYASMAVHNNVIDKLQNDYLNYKIQLQTKPLQLIKVYAATRSDFKSLSLKIFIINQRFLALGQ